MILDIINELFIFENYWLINHSKCLLKKIFVIYLF